MPKGKKKGKKSNRAFEEDFEDDGDDLDALKRPTPTEEPLSPPSPASGASGKRGKKKGKKKKQSGPAFDDDSDDGDDPLAGSGGNVSGFAALGAMSDGVESESESDSDGGAPAAKASGFAALMAGAEEESEEESEEEEVVRAKPSGFDLLAGGGEGSESEESEDEAPVAVASGFAALAMDDGDDDEEEEDEEEEGEAEVVPVVGEVTSIEAHPKADRLRILQVSDGSLVHQVVSNAKNIKVGSRVALALPGCTTPGSKIEIGSAAVRGVDSGGMVCSSHDLGWVPASQDLALLCPSDWQLGSAVPLERPQGLEEPVEGEADLSAFGEKKKKKKDKKKKSADPGQAAGEGGEAADLSAFGEKKKKKKSSKKAKEDAGQDEDDLSAFGEKKKKKKSSKASKQEPEPEPEPEPITEQEPESEPEAAPVEQEEEAPSFDASAFQSKSAKKRAKKKGKTKPTAPAAVDEDDIDAILAALDGPSAPEEPQATELAAPEAPAATGESGEGEGEAEAEAEVDNGGKPLTANQKKKLKKKQKEAERKAKLAAGEVEDAPVDSPVSKGKGKGKPMNAAVRKMQEELERRKAAEEEQARLEAEERAREEAEEAARLEEERAKEEKRRLKKEKEREKKERMRKEGKLLTGKAKEEAKRLAAMREQMLKAAGIEIEQDPKPAKVVYGKKKKRAPPKPQEPEPAAEMPAPSEPEIPAPKVEAPAALEEESAMEEWDEVDWESKIDRKSSSPASWVEVEREQVIKDMRGGEGSEEGSDEYSESDEDSDEELERRVAAARRARQRRYELALKARTPDHLRSPICCILGHVDTGKTKILDKIRGTSVQDGEAGGITQQIGATYIPSQEVRDRTTCLGENQESEMRVPGLLVIDTPGHESFTNLRSRGSGLCDLAVLVVDIMHGLEKQTVESINLLKMRKTPFIIALNKIDRLYDWKAKENAPFRDTLEAQEDFVQQEFKSRYDEAVLALNEQGLNVALYYENPDLKSYVSVVPTSAITGEGIPDILNLLVSLSQQRMVERLMHVEFLQCTLLEVKAIEGLGTTIDVILINGTLHEGDTIVVCGLQGPIVTSVRALLTPHPMREMRVKGSYLHHKQIEAAQGVKICANNLEGALAGTNLYVLSANDDLDHLKEEVVSDVQSILGQVDKSGEGVCVQASTLGSLEALLEFLKSPDVQIPVSGISIGPVHKKDVMRSSIMLEKRKEFAVILAFDVQVTREAREQAKELGVKIFTADIIYHLFDQFTDYMKQVREERRKETEFDATFPCVLKIIPSCIFNKKDPIVLGVEILAGIAKVGSPLCIPTQDFIEIGRIASMEKNHKAVDKAFTGDSVAMKICSTTALEASRMYGRHFDHTDELVSRISRHSINLLKENYKDDLTKDDWLLMLKLKALFQIQ